MKNATTNILWAVYISLLAVLWPHTAWLFRQFEPAQSSSIYGNFTWADLSSYIAAFAFEAAIAALTHKLAKKIEKTKPIYKIVKNTDGSTSRQVDAMATIRARYANWFTFGLLITAGASAMANLAHAVQFGHTLKIFTDWGIPQSVYSIAFGGLLPLVSLTFASVLSEVVEDEEAPNPEVETARGAISELKKQLRESELRVKATEDQVKQALAQGEERVKATEEQVKIASLKSEDRVKAAEERVNQIAEQARALIAAAEDKARIAEERFGAAGDLMKYLFSEDKRQRILTVHQKWPQLKNAAIAVIAESSESHVSAVLKEIEVVDAVSD